MADVRASRLARRVPQLATNPAHRSRSGMTPTALGQSRVVVRGRLSTLEPIAELYPPRRTPYARAVLSCSFVGHGDQLHGSGITMRGGGPCSLPCTGNSWSYLPCPSRAEIANICGPVRPFTTLRCFSLWRSPGTHARGERYVRIAPVPGTSPQLGAHQPFRPRRAASSSTALLNTRQVAATHPANFAGLTAVGFRGHTMTQVALSTPGMSSTLIRASWTISPEASSIRFGTGISWSSQ
jgi:hypothetical protein